MGSTFTASLMRLLIKHSLMPKFPPYAITSLAAPHSQMSLTLGRKCHKIHTLRIAEDVGQCAGSESRDGWRRGASEQPEHQRPSHLASPLIVVELKSLAAGKLACRPITMRVPQN
jgi:hypothetical protein